MPSTTLITHGGIVDFLVYLVEGLLGILTAMIAAYARYIHGKTEDTANALAEFKTFVATNHPTNDGIDRRFDKVDEKLEKISDKIDALKGAH